MTEPVRPWNEAERLKFLHELRIVDTPAEARFDRITRIVCRSLHVPIAAISFVDRSRQWFKSIQGLSVSETPRDVAFCSHAIMSNAPLIVPDARLDPRFCDNPLVTGEPNIRFYAGFPLVFNHDIRVGTLCAIDREPHRLSPGEMEIILDLRDLVMSELGSIALAEATAALSASEERASRASMAKSRFLKNMSHEVRTPLHGMVVAADILSLEATTDRQRKYIEAIQTSGRRLTGIVDEIFDFTEIETGGVKLAEDSIDLQGMIDEAVSGVQPLADGKHLYIRTVLDESVRTRMVGDARRIRQILVHLLRNAVEHTRAGGVTISARLAPAPQSAGDRMTLRIALCDTGVGIAPERIETLFEPFSQVDASGTRSQAGAGLGLAICKRLVEAMNGEISVDSSLRQGSTFRFSVELAAPAATIQPRTPCARELPRNVAPAPAKQFVGRRILVAEDVKTSRMAISSLLESLGCIVDAADDGVEALHKIRGNRYDAVLMDCQMPIVDGYTATRLIRQEGRSQLPIVAVTANATAEDREEASNAGIDDYLSKPFVKAELVEVLNRVLK